jgi:alpha-L-rhamnosidase
VDIPTDCPQRDERLGWTGDIRCVLEYEGWPGIGDWLSINADTPRDLIGTAFWAYDAGLMAQIATVLGKEEDADRYRRLQSKVKQTFMDRYLKGSTVPVAVAKPSEIRLRLERNDAIARGNLEAGDYRFVVI